ncbi:MAG: phosphate acyltransferase PlsX [Bacteroidia bacterium]|nr:phosphate acyltransferase PlsX [Bacteroidia bacterium]
MKIALDIFGGDYAPKATTLGAILAQKELPENVRLILIGNKNEIVSILNEQGVSESLFEIIHTTDSIGMSEHPTKAFQQKPKSSISIGFNLLKEGQIAGFCSAGNTGAMMVGAYYSIKAVAGVIRPCITSILPKSSGKLGIFLDVGTNADCKPDVLYQFGILGSLYAEHVLNIPNPKVALLNIGEEPEKGNLTTQAAHNLMKDTTEFNFVGNVEARDLFADNFDVLVCEGFVGNVMLKEAEAFYTLIKKSGIKNDFFDKMNYELYGGTPILGINGNVVVGHGISNETAIKNMVLLTHQISEAKLSEKIKNFIQVKLNIN